jgi:putative DNA primase/helicase
VCLSSAEVQAVGKDASDHLAAGKGLDDFVPISLPPTSDARDSAADPEITGCDPLVLEAAHAEVLARTWRDVYRWSQHERSWRHWTGRVWKLADESVVVNAAQKVLRRHYGRLLAKGQTAAEDKRLRDLHASTCRYASVQKGLAFLRGEPGFHTEFEEWDADPYLLNCADGILDLRTQALGPHTASMLCTKVTKWAYGSEESTGAWEAHLTRWLPDADVRRQVMRDLGRALAGAALEESLPIWYGTGANGKTTTTRSVLMGLGSYGKQAVKDLLVASKYERHSTDLADLAGSRLVIAEEIQDGRHLDEATVKMLTGGNRQKARFMRCDNFEFEQTFSIFLLVNHRPVIAGTDRGIWRRLRVVPWSVSIAKEEQRPQEEVVAELMADGSWMLRWMVAGFADWQVDHHWVANAVTVATAAYEVDQDVLAGFLGRKCVANTRATTSVEDLYAAYLSDSEEYGEEGVEPLSKIAFGRQLRSRGMTQLKAAGGVRTWTGIGLVATSGRKSAPTHEGTGSDE